LAEGAAAARASADSASCFELQAASIVAFHDGFLAGRDAPLPAEPAPWWQWIEENHRSNTALWREEDRARRSDVPDSEIVRCKRNIDALNQRRNDAVEALDDCLLAALERVVPAPAPDARLSSETAGAIIDRLSILALKIHHMRQASQRREAGAEHMQRCADKLATLVAQRKDLATCLDRLLHEASCGVARFRTYRQFKMYNDPSLNPELYQRSR